METDNLSPNAVVFESRAFSIKQFPRRKEAARSDKAPAVSLGPLLFWKRGGKTRTKGLETLVTKASKNLSEASFTGLWGDYTIFGRLWIPRTVCPRDRALLPLTSANRIIIVALSYSDPRNLTDRQYNALKGTKSDFHLILKHFKFRHDDTSGRFILLNDFGTEFEDASGVSRIIPPSDTHPDAIRTAIESAMQASDGDNRILFYFAGHGILVDGAEEKCNSSLNNFARAIVAGNGEHIYGWELRSWFCGFPSRSASIVAVFDACHTGGILGLPYSCEIERDDIRVHRSSKEKVPIEMLEISASRWYQQAFSNTREGEMYGQLSWCLLQYLRTTGGQSVDGLTRYLDGNCDRYRSQEPQICYSRQLKGPRILSNST